MTKLEELKAAIAEIEEVASSGIEDKDELYDLLIKAYHHQKDIIVLLEDTQPEPKVIVDNDKVKQLTAKVLTLQNELDHLTELVDSLRSILCSQNG